MDARHHELIGPFFHGTGSQAATAIVKEGFRRGRSRNYTGTGVCLSETLSVAYEYGMYETGGCVLQTWLAPTSWWADQTGCVALERMADRDTWDDFFKTSGLDAVRAYGGTVWVVWNPQALTVIRRLSHREAIQGLCSQFDKDGPDNGYNAVVSDYAAIWWGREGEDRNLARSADHVRRLQRTLTRCVGRTQSQLLCCATASAEHAGCPSPSPAASR